MIFGPPCVNMNQHVKYLGQRSSSSDVIVLTHRHTHLTGRMVTSDTEDGSNDH